MNISELEITNLSDTLYNFVYNSNECIEKKIELGKAIAQLKFYAIGYSQYRQILSERYGEA